MRYIAMLLLLSTTSLSAGGLGNVWAGFGFANVTQTYDNSGNAVNLKDLIPGATDASMSVLNLNVGGMYNVLSLPMQAFFVGADFRLSQWKQSISSSLGSTDLSSGFSPQNLALFVGMRGPLYHASLGFLLDMGPEVTNPGDYPNSDRQNALQFRAGAWLPNPMMALFGGLHYTYTLEGKSGNVAYDMGDVLDVHLGGGYKFPLGEAGLIFTYTMKTKATQGGVEQSNSDGNLITVLPYVKLGLPLFPVSFKLLFGAMDEYSMYGFSLSGKNMPVTRLGATLKASMGF
jgi:hypothetical protein